MNWLLIIAMILAAATVGCGKEEKRPIYTPGSGGVRPPVVKEGKPS